MRFALNLGKRPVLAALPLFLLALPAWAGDTALFENQLADALGQYRDAYAHSGPTLSDGKAAIEGLNAFAAAWTTLRSRWTAAPPPEYSEDLNFAEEMESVSAIAAQAQRQAQAGAIGQAHATLGQIRALLAEMRRRNGLHGFADEMDAFDDRLSEEGDALFDDPKLSSDQIGLLLEQTAVLTYLGERLQKQSPPNLADDTNFLEMTDELNRQVRGLQGTAVAGQRDPIMAALADLRRQYDRLWLLYGG